MTPWSQILQVTRREHARFIAALSDPRAAQQCALQAILQANRECDFGRQHGFARMRDADDFRAAVPVQDYASLAPAIEAMMAGASGRLCAEPAVIYEQTSGSAGAAKHIPYTAASLAAFRRALYPWLHDLAYHYPAVTAGRVYFCVSPVARAAVHTADGTPIGVDDDGAYFGPELMPALGRLSVAPPPLAKVPDIEVWRYLTLRCLLDADDLSLISVWSPTFLLSLLDALPDLADKLVEDIARGTVSAPAHLAVGELPFRPRADRAAAVSRALARGTPDTVRLWPRLGLISCWTHANAARFVAALQRAFPHAALQGKGLLATEGIVSFPLAEHSYPVLASASGFFEFLDDTGRSRLAHEVEEGADYAILLTTPGGLYRYSLGDRVRIRGFAGRTPLMEFIGRDGAVGDLCGEKVTEAQVQAGLPPGAGFAVLATSLDGVPHYRLVLDAAQYDPSRACDLAAGMDQALGANPQYAYARRLGQLGPVRPVLCASPMARYTDWAVRQGRRLGDIKPPLLHTDTDWESVFGPSRLP